ncbi:MAG TPA: hypothetical protein VMU75_09345 [Acidimicrobiales bacterium]|nr:hypothetical protein [Acidimicrobiales bacterium]
MIRTDVAPPATPVAAPRRRIASADRIALAILVLLPMAIDLPFSLSGHPLLPGDALVQNFPLRVLSGELIRSGHLPAWDRLIWSGTPLLAGWNAGSMFPGTWLFAVLPPIAAWTVNYVAVPIVAGTGTYLLLRRLSCRPLSSTLGALAFTYAGFLDGQVVHIGLMEGTALLPWMLVAVDGIVRRLRSGSSADGLVGYVVLLGVSCALATLAGDPRAVSSAAIVLLVYLIALVLRDRRRAGLLVGAVLAAAALGALLSAVQWLPGLGFLHSSQRGVTAYDFFGTGSITLSEMGTLLVAPFLLGGNSNFGMPVYGGSYNLPELTIGVGIVALVAFMAYLPELGGSLLAFLRAKRAGPAAGSAGGRRQLGVWYVLAGLGVVLGLGTNTALGHLLVHLPLYGGQRLQNRNIVMTDLALAVLLAYLVEDLTDRRARSRRERWPERRDEAAPAADGSGGPIAGAKEGPLTAWTSRLLALTPVLAVFALVGWAYAAPAAVELHFGFAVVNPSQFDELTPYLASQLAVAGAVGAYVVLHRRLAARAARVALAVLILADVGIYVANASYATAPSSILGQANPWSTAVARYTGPTGRFAIYNPLFQQPSPDQFALLELGVSDMNVLQGNASVQGYGSIVDNIYQDATDTHRYEDLDTARLDDTTFDTLDMRTLITLPTYFQESLPPHSAIPVAGAPAVTATGAPGSTIDAPAPAPGGTGPWTIEPGQRQAWLLASPMTVVRLSVIINPQLSGRPPSVGIAVVPPGRTPHFASVPVRDGRAQLALPSAERADQIVVENPSKGTTIVGAVVVVTRAPSLRLLLDGALQGQIEPPHWVFGGVIRGYYDVYLNTQTLGLAWLQPASSTTPNTLERAPGTVTTTSSAPYAPQTMVVDSPRPAVLVRSETYAPGWSARLTPLSGGPTRVITSHRFGLVQAVSVPAGRYKVTWRYTSHNLRTGLVLSAIGFVFLAVLCVLALRRRRSPGRRRRRPTTSLHM